MGYGAEGYCTGSDSDTYRVSHDDRIAPGTVRLIFIETDRSCVRNAQSSVTNMQMVHICADTERGVYGHWLKLADETIDSRCYRAREGLIPKWNRLKEFIKRFVSVAMQIGLASINRIRHSEVARLCSP